MQLYGDGTDFNNWVEVWLNGQQVTFNDPAFGWTITSPTNSDLSRIARPITDGVLTFINDQTGTVQIVGARRPRRTTQFSENRGVATRDLNQAVTDIIAMLREDWDKINDRARRPRAAWRNAEDPCCGRQPREPWCLLRQHRKSGLVRFGSDVDVRGRQRHPVHRHQPDDDHE
jgi:hypothetical protein